MTAPVRLLFPYVGGDQLSGSHISSLEMVRMLGETDEYQPIVGLHRPEGTLGAFIREQGMDFVRLPGIELLDPRTLRGRRRIGGAFTYLSRSVPTIRRFITENAISIVHTNDGRIHASWTLPTALSPAFHVWHHRGDPAATGVNKLAPFLADRIITVSRFSKPGYPLRPIDHKLSVVYSPFDPGPPVNRDAARSALLAEIGAPPQTRFLAYVGVLNERKRPVHFIDAVADYKMAYPDMPVMGLLFGTVREGGPALDQAALDRARERGISDRIRLMGFKSPLSSYMAAVDLLLVTALNEPFGRTLVEAMLLGTVVIATDHGGNPEAILDGATGFLVDPNDSRAFVAPIHQMLSDSEAHRRMREAAHGHATKAFNPENHLRGILDVYDSLLPRPKRSL